MVQIFHNPFKEIPAAEEMYRNGAHARPLNKDPFIESPEIKKSREEKNSKFWNDLFPEGNPYILNPAKITSEVTKAETTAPLKMPERVEPRKGLDLGALFAPQVSRGAGLAAFPEKELGAIAQNQGDVAKYRAEREKSAFQETQGNLEKYTDVLQGQLDLQNQVYTDWMQRDAKARDALDGLQAKYPTLTRAELVNNMSVGEKITSSLLTLLGAASGAPPDKNPALAVFNRSLDEVIANQNLNYERERQNIVQTKMFSDQTFNVASSNIQAIGNLNSNLLQNQLALTQAKASIASEEEILANARSAEDSIKLQIINSRLADQRARYELSLQERQYDFMRQTDKFERFAVATVPVASPTGGGKFEVKFQQSQGFFLNKDAKAKALEQNVKNVDAIKQLQFLEQAIKAEDKGEVRTQAALLSSPPYNIKLPDVDGWLVGKFAAKDVLSGGGAINNAIRTLAESSNEILNNATFAPLSNE